MLPRKPLQLIYYQTLDLNAPDVEAHFKQIMGNIFPEVDQRVIHTLWRVDNLPKFTGTDKSFAFKVAEDVCRWREHLGHLDHLIIRKLGNVKTELPRYFLSLGGCRHPNQLENGEALRDVMDYLVVPGASYNSAYKDFTPFIRYLKENEAQIP